jgi:hypothetical protein
VDLATADLGIGAQSDRRTARLALASLAVAAAAAFLLSTCSEMGFPSVHDMPAPRADTTLTPDQVKQATDDLISQRDHLSTEAQTTGQIGAASNAAANAPGTQPPRPPATAQPAVQVVDPAAPQTAGAYARP